VHAHPRAWRRGYGVSDAEMAALARAGLSRTRGRSPDHAAADRAALRALAADLGVFVTGASDDHGELTGHRLGSETTPLEAYAALRSAAPVRR
jgi:hypothetical protein